MSWNRVKWSEAGQIASLLGWPVKADPKMAQPPQTFFAGLREAGRLDEAALFLGQALPRFEAVAWAARAVRDLTPEPPEQAADAAALRAALLWVQDPSDARRRAAFNASAAATDDGAERLAALAVFFSGGSLAPDNCTPVPAPKEAAGKFGAAAVLLAASRTGDRKAALQKALDLGDQIASGSLA